MRLLSKLWRGDLGVALLLLGLILAFLWPAALGGKALLPADNLFASPPWRDFAADVGVAVPHNELINDMLVQNLPWKRFAQQTVTAGELPLWNPYIFSGTPFLAAGQQAVLYPPGAIFYLMPVAHAYAWFTALHLLLGGLFMYAYLRMIGGSRLGGLVSAIAFVFAGFMWVSFVWPMVISTVVWLPLLLAAIEGVVRGGSPEATLVDRRRLWWWLGGAIAVGLMLLAGHVEYAFYGLFTAAVYAAFRLGGVLIATRRFGAALLSAVLLLAMVGVGVAVAAAQLLPFVELMGENYRAGLVSYEQVVGWALPQRQLLAFVMPDVFGNPSHHTYLDVFDGQMKAFADGALSYPFWGIKNYVEGTAYVGLLPLLLAAVALVAGRGGQRWFFAAYALFALVLAFGSPLYRLFFYGVPGFDQLHTPFRWIFPYSVSVAVLAGLGATALREGRDGRIGRPSAGRIGAVAIAVGGLTLAGLGVARLASGATLAFAEGLRQRSATLATAFASSEALVSYEARNVLLFAALLMASGVAVWLLAGPPEAGRRRWAASVAVAVLVADLFVYGHDFNSRSDAALADYLPPSLTWLRQDADLFRVVTYNYDDTLRPNLGMLADLYDARGHDSIILKRYPQFWGLMERPQGLLYNQINKLVEPTSLSSPLLDLMNVKYVLSTGNIRLPNYTEVYRGEINIYRNDDFLPRAFAVFAARMVATPEAALVNLADPAFDPRREVVLEAEDSTGRATDVASLAPASDATAILPMEGRVASYSPNRVVVTADMPAAGYVVLADTYYPGWEARVDGVATPILRADYIYRAVRVESGEHEIVFQFSPWSFKLGLFVSFLAATVLALVAAYAIWRAVFPAAEETSTVRRVAKNSLAPIVGQLSSRLLDFAFAIVMLRLLGPEQAGRFAFAVILIGYFAILTDFGLGTLLTREVARDRAVANRYLANTIVLRLLLCAASAPLLAGVVGLYAWRFELAWDTGVAAALLALSLAPASFSSAFSAAFNAHERMEYPAFVTVAISVLRVGLGVIALLLGYGIVGLAGVSLVATLATAVVLFALVRRLLFRPRLEADLAFQRGMAGEALPLMVNNFLATIFFRVDVMLLKPMQGDLAVGYYTTAYKFIDGLNILPAFLTMAIFPVMSRYAATAPDSLRRAFGLVLRWLLAIAFPVAVGTTLIADKLIVLCFGADYAPSVAALQVLIWFLPLSYVNSVTQYALIAVNRQRFLTLAFVIGAGFNIVANLVIIPSFGYLGASVVTVVSELALFVPFWWAVRRYMGGVPLLASALRPALAALAMGAALLALQGMNIVAMVVVGAVVYGVALVALRGVTRDDVALLRRLAKGESATVADRVGPA